MKWPIFRLPQSFPYTNLREYLLLPKQKKVETCHLSLVEYIQEKREQEFNFSETRISQLLGSINTLKCLLPSRN
jgi:hypothetical protein